MDEPLQVLIISDSKGDVPLLSGRLRHRGYSPVCNLLDSKESFVQGLKQQRWQLVLCVHGSQISTLEALEIFQQSDQLIPFIVISSLAGEDIAVETVKAGADDYIMKDNLSHLVPSVEVAMRETKLRIERKQTREQLQFHFDLEKVITAISTSFIELPLKNLDKGIDDALHIIADFTNADRSYVFQFSSNGNYATNTHEWCAAGIAPAVDRLREIPTESMPWIFERIKRGQVVHVDDVEMLGKEAEPEKKEFLAESIKSLISVPMVCSGGVIGFIGFDSVKEQKSWPNEVVTLLRIVGEIFASAIDRKKAEQQREKLLRTLATKNEELESILYVASHDLRSPLVNIQGFSNELAMCCKEMADALKNDQDITKTKHQLIQSLKTNIPEAVEFILASSEKMDSLINGLLKLSRLGKTEMVITTIDMDEMLLNITMAMKYQMQQANVKIETEPLAKCRGDRSQINQIFSNLLDNAMKYLDKSRQTMIRISSKSGLGRVVYCVEDNGVGIDNEHLARIFEIFHRLEPDGVPGEGLGLTIVRRILERHNGHVWVESKPGKGSKFFIELPK